MIFKKFIYALSLSCTLLLSHQAHAHHTSGQQGTSSVRSNLYLLHMTQTNEHPKYLASANLGYKTIDRGLGRTMRYDFGFEYGLLSNLSLGANIPILSIREKFLPRVDDLGDISMSIKWTPFPKSKSKFNFGLQNELSIPTGSEDHGSGAGSVGIYPSANLNYRFNQTWNWFTSLGGSLLAESNSQTSINYATGISFMIPGSRLPVSLLAIVSGSTFLNDSSYTSGSTKIYLQPGISFQPTKKLNISALFQLSIMDQLKSKLAGGLSPTDPAILNDIESGFSLLTSLQF